MKQTYLEILNEKFEDVSKKIENIENLIWELEEAYGNYSEVIDLYEDNKVILEEIQYHIQLKIEKVTG